MELNRIAWNVNDGKLFLEFLHSHSNREKQAWAKRILNTNLDVLVVPTKTMHSISNTIFLGNYKSFLNLKLFANYESIAIFGMIVSKIENFDEMKSYLDVYVDAMENWAHCDLLSFKIKDSNEDDFIRLSEQYVTSSKVFVRRLGLFILFHLIRDKKYLDYTFNTLSKFQNETEYYVIMMGGWLLSESIIRYKEEALLNLNIFSINPKIINKGIQKCRESRRLIQEEKNKLLVYKISQKK